MNKKEYIFQTALHEFVKNGFHGTPTSRIAKHAGVATGTLFHHFKTKEELIIELYLKLKKDLSAAIVNGLGAAQTPKEELIKIYSNSIHWGIDHPLEFKYFELFRTSPFFTTLTSKEVKNKLTIHYSILSKIVEPNDPKTIKLYYTLFLSHMFGVNNHLLNSKLSKKQKEQFIDDSFKIVWKMFS